MKNPLAGQNFAGEKIRVVIFWENGSIDNTIVPVQKGHAVISKEWKPTFTVSDLHPIPVYKRKYVFFSSVTYEMGIVVREGRDKAEPIDYGPDAETKKLIPPLALGDYSDIANAAWLGLLTRRKPIGWMQWIPIILMIILIVLEILNLSGVKIHVG